MKTRYSSLVDVKKNMMQKSERVVLSKKSAMANADEALKISYEDLQLIHSPEHGKITDFLSTRTLFDSQRALISHNEKWLTFAKKEYIMAQEQLKKDTIEFEKFQYLEAVEIEKELKIRKIKEAKDLDEIALITHARKDKEKVA